MVKDSIAMNIPIALAYGAGVSEFKDGEGWIKIDHESHHCIRENLCMGVPEIVQECSDGTMVIMLPGQSLGRVINVIQSKGPYITCEYEEVLGSSELRPENILLLRRLKTQLEKWVAKFVKLDCQKDVLTPCLSECSEVVGLYTEFMVDCPELKQKVLEISDINDKIHFLVLNCQK